MKYKLLKTRSGEIRYRIRKSRKAKRISIVINPAGWAELVVPWAMPSIFGEKFLRNKGQWAIDKIAQVNNRQGLLCANNPDDYKKYKRLAAAIVKDKIKYYNSHYGYKIGRIFIRNQKSRWGSCSSDGNLNFNYKIIYLPEQLADYLIVHELCHLREMNHSGKFWDLVGMMIPDYKILKRKLRNLS